MDAEILKTIKPEVLKQIKTFLEDRQKKRRSMHVAKLFPAIRDKFHLTEKQASTAAYAWHQYLI